MATSGPNYLTSIANLGGGTGSWNSTDTVANLNSDNAVYAVYSKPSGTGQTSPGLRCYGFGTFTGVGSGDTINHVTIEANAFLAHVSRMAPFTYELWNGQTGIIGTAQTGTSTTTTSNIDTFDITGVTYSQLATLEVRVYGHGGTNSTASTSSVDYVRLTVDYTPASQDATVTTATTLAAPAAFPAAIAAGHVTVAAAVLAAPASFPPPAAILGRPKVTVTFVMDDARETQYTGASPTDNIRYWAAQHGVHLTLYVPSNWVGQHPAPGQTWNMMTWAEIADFAADGNEIANHTANHYTWASDLTTWQNELSECDSDIQAQGYPHPVSFSYPVGAWNSTAAQAVIDAGMYMAHCGDPDLLTPPTGAESMPPAGAGGLGWRTARMARNYFPSSTTLASDVSYAQGLAGRSWLIYITHEGYSPIPTDFHDCLNWCAANGIPVKSVKEVLVDEGVLGNAPVTLQLAAAFPAPQVITPDAAAAPAVLAAPAAFPAPQVTVPGAGWDIIQSAGSGSVSGNPSATYGSALTSGTKLVAVAGCCANFATSRIPTAVRDAASNAFTCVANSPTGQTQGNYPPSVSLWVLDTPAGDVGLTPAITATMPSGVNQSVLVIMEVSGLKTGTSIIDGTAGTALQASGTSVTQPSYSDTAASELLFSLACEGGDNTTVTNSGYTLDSHSVQGGFGTQFQVGYKDSTGGAESGTWTGDDVSNSIAMLVAAVQLAAGGGQGATATPAVLAAPAAFPVPVVRQDRTVTPAVLAAPAAFPAAAVHGSANASPAVLAAPASFPAAAAHGSAVTAPAVLPAPAAFGAVTPAGHVTATPAVLAAPAAFGAVTVSGSANVTPAVLAAPASFPAPQVTAGGNAEVTATVLAAPAAFPVPTVRQDQQAAPAVLPAPAAFPAPSVTAGGSAEVTPAVLAAPAAFPAPVVRQDRTVTPAVHAAPVTFPAPSVTAGGSATVNATALPAPAAFPAPVVRQDQRPAPAVLAAPAAFPAVTVRQDRTVTVIRLTAPAAFPAAQAGGGAGTSPAVLAVTATFPAPAVSNGLTLFPAALTVTVAFPAAGIVKQAVFGIAAHTGGPASTAAHTGGPASTAAYTGAVLATMSNEGRP